MPPQRSPSARAAAAAELTALEKAIAEKTAALKKAGDEVVAAAQAVLSGPRQGSAGP